MRRRARVDSRDSSLRLGPLLVAILRFWRSRGLVKVGKGGGWGTWGDGLNEEWWWWYPLMKGTGYFAYCIRIHRGIFVYAYFNIEWSFPSQFSSWDLASSMQGCVSTLYLVQRSLIVFKLLFWKTSSNLKVRFLWIFYIVFSLHSPRVYFWYSKWV